MRREGSFHRTAVPRLAAARSRSGSDTTPRCHSLPSRRFATPASRTPSADGIAFSSGSEGLILQAKLRMRCPRPQTARLALWESSAAGGERESRLPLKRGNDYLFLCLKEKGRKRSRPTFRWIVAPINCVAMTFSAPEGTVPQMAVSPTPEAKRLESVGSRTGGFDLMGAVRVRPRHANHGTQTVWVCVPRFVGISIKWMQGCADGTSPPPLGNFCPPCGR